MLPNVDVDSVPAVAAFVRSTFDGLFPGAGDKALWRLFDDVDALFAGRDPSYRAIDLRYHNLRHTLMATVCMAQILEGQHASGGEDQIKARDFELGIAGVLLHDTGYLKLRADAAGTGAKYTYCHIVRSCAFAASYLPGLGATDAEVEGVLAAISCTGPNSDISRLRFRSPESRFIGCALTTADYLGQLSDPHYPDKLGELYRELRESDDFANVPRGRRVFKSEADLVRRTPAFWNDFVRPRLEGDFQGVYRFLERPAKSGKNAYLEAIEANFERIRTLIDEAALGTRPN